MGGNNPIRLQSMTNTSTSDTLATVKQVLRIAARGADYIRLTVQGRKEADNLSNIVAELSKKQCNVPLIADIHFNPTLALIAAPIVDKVRINPGNYIDRKNLKPTIYTDEEYKVELERISTELTKLLNVCRQHNTAIRIGTNHGSLSDRILSRFGDTPEGMAESAMEFLRICKQQDFNNMVVSMKASNTRIMVYATRLLVKKMDEEGLNYPVHLGVTEAGEGEDGRIRSAVGIGALLADGIGDTIRVSLTEDPEIEIPVAMKIVEYINSRENHEPIVPFNKYPLDPYNYRKRHSIEIKGTGGKNLPVVIHSFQGPVKFEGLNRIGWNFSKKNGWKFTDHAPDYLFADHWPDEINIPEGKHVILPAENIFEQSGIPGIIGYYDSYRNLSESDAGLKFIRILASELTTEVIDTLKNRKSLIIVLETDNENGFADQRAAIFRMMNLQCKLPVILKRDYNETNAEDLQLKASMDLGGLFIDGLGDGIWLENEGNIDDTRVISTSFGILQASRLRQTKTEFISCPSCGRTLFDLQTTTKKIMERTSHLKGLKIGIMGCIVNGPGEMADADYGYVGAGKGRITLYKEKQVIKKNIPEQEAVDALVNLIKANNDWIEPEN